MRVLILTVDDPIQDLVGAIDGSVQFDNGAAEKRNEVEAATVRIRALGALGRLAFLTDAGVVAFGCIVARVLIERYGGER